MSAAFRALVWSVWENQLDAFIRLHLLTIKDRRGEMTMVTKVREVSSVQK